MTTTAARHAAQTAHPLGPDSLAWRLGFPRTGLLLAGRALFLQTAHPVIGAGVRDHSNFRTDPWGRLERTVDSLLVQLFGGTSTVAEAQRLREVHRSIQGTGFDGKHYSALNPEAYAWVHMSNLETALMFNDMFVRRLAPWERRRMVREWREVGLVLGVRDDLMPSTEDELHAYVDDMVRTTLRVNDTCVELLDSLSLTDVPPPYRAIPEPIWRAARPVGRSLVHLTTVGTLPVPLRDALGQTWTERDEQRLQRFASAVRTASPLVPKRALQYPLAYRATRAAKRYMKGRTA
jgi:uncharacterized protein (DUF2236 family)